MVQASDAMVRKMSRQDPHEQHLLLCCDTPRESCYHVEAAEAAYVPKRALLFNGSEWRTDRDVVLRKSKNLFDLNHGTTIPRGTLVQGADEGEWVRLGIPSDSDEFSKPSSRFANGPAVKLAALFVLVGLVLVCVVSLSSRTGVSIRGITPPKDADYAQLFSTKQILGREGERTNDGTDGRDGQERPMGQVEVILPHAEPHGDSSLKISVKDLTFDRMVRKSATTLIYEAPAKVDPEGSGWPPPSIQVGTSALIAQRWQLAKAELRTPVHQLHNVNATLELWLRFTYMREDRYLSKVVLLMEHVLFKHLSLVSTYNKLISENETAQVRYEIFERATKDSVDNLEASVQKHTKETGRISSLANAFVQDCCNASSLQVAGQRKIADLAEPLRSFAKIRRAVRSYGAAQENFEAKSLRFLEILLRDSAQLRYKWRAYPLSPPVFFRGQASTGSKYTAFIKDTQQILANKTYVEMKKHRGALQSHIEKLKAILKFVRFLQQVRVTRTSVSSLHEYDGWTFPGVLTRAELWINSELRNQSVLAECEEHNAEVAKQLSSLKQKFVTVARVGGDLTALKQEADRVRKKKRSCSKEKDDCVRKAAKAYEQLKQSYELLCYKVSEELKLEDASEMEQDGNGHTCLKAAAHRLDKGLADAARNLNSTFVRLEDLQDDLRHLDSLIPMLYGKTVGIVNVNKLKEHGGHVLGGADAAMDKLSALQQETETRHALSRFIQEESDGLQALVPSSGNLRRWYGVSATKLQISRCFSRCRRAQRSFQEMKTANLSRQSMRQFLYDLDNFSAAINDALHLVAPWYQADGQKLSEEVARLLSKIRVELKARLPKGMTAGCVLRTAAMWKEFNTVVGASVHDTGQACSRKEKEFIHNLQDLIEMDREMAISLAKSNRQPTSSSSIVLIVPLTAKRDAGIARFLKTFDPGVPSENASTAYPVFDKNWVAPMLSYMLPPEAQLQNEFSLESRFVLSQEFPVDTAWLSGKMQTVAENSVKGGSSAQGVLAPEHRQVQQVILDKERVNACAAAYGGFANLYSGKTVAESSLARFTFVVTALCVSLSVAVTAFVIERYPPKKGEWKQLKKFGTPSTISDFLPVLVVFFLIHTVLLVYMPYRARSAATCLDGYPWTPHYIYMFFQWMLRILELIVYWEMGGDGLGYMWLLFKLFMGVLGALDFYTDGTFVSIAYVCRGVVFLGPYDLWIWAAWVYIIGVIAFQLIAPIAIFFLSPQSRGVVILRLLNMEVLLTYYNIHLSDNNPDPSYTSVLTDTPRSGDSLGTEKTNPASSQQKGFQKTKAVAAFIFGIVRFLFEDVLQIPLQTKYKMVIPSNATFVTCSLAISATGALISLAIAIKDLRDSRNEFISFEKGDSLLGSVRPFIVKRKFFAYVILGWTEEMMEALEEAKNMGLDKEHIYKMEEAMKQKTLNDLNAAERQIGVDALIQTLNAYSKFKSDCKDHFQTELKARELAIENLESAMKKPGAKGLLELLEKNEKVKIDKAPFSKEAAERRLKESVVEFRDSIDKEKEKDFDDAIQEAREQSVDWGIIRAEEAKGNELKGELEKREQAKKALEGAMKKPGTEALENAVQKFENMKIEKASFKKELEERRIAIAGLEQAIQKSGTEPLANVLQKIGDINIDQALFREELEKRQRAIADLEGAQKKQGTEALGNVLQKVARVNIDKAPFKEILERRQLAIADFEEAMKKPGTKALVNAFQTYEDVNIYKADFEAELKERTKKETCCLKLHVATGKQLELAIEEAKDAGVDAAEIETKLQLRRESLEDEAKDGQSIAALEKAIREARGEGVDKAKVSDAEVKLKLLKEAQIRDAIQKSIHFAAREQESMYKDCSGKIMIALDDIPKRISEWETKHPEAVVQDSATRDELKQNFISAAENWRTGNIYALQGLCHSESLYHTRASEFEKDNVKVHAFPVCIWASDSFAIVTGIVPLDSNKRRIQKTASKTPPSDILSFWMKEDDQWKLIVMTDDPRNIKVPAIEELGVWAIEHLAPFQNCKNETTLPSNFIASLPEYKPSDGGNQSAYWTWTPAQLGSSVSFPYAQIVEFHYRGRARLFFNPSNCVVSEKDLWWWTDSEWTVRVWSLANGKITIGEGLQFDH